MAVLTMAFPRQPVATHGNGFAYLSRFRGARICHRLPRVATAGLFLKKGCLSSCRLSESTSYRAPGRSDTHLFLGAWRAHRVGGSCLGFSIP